MTRFPHAGGNRGKKRPAVLIQADVYNSKLKHFILAEITTNLAAAADPASFLIDGSTPEGVATGLNQNSVACCLFLSPVSEAGITKVIGKLSDAMNLQLDACLTEGGATACLKRVTWRPRPAACSPARGASSSS